MIAKKPPRPLVISGELRRRINQIAHADGQKHEIAMRVRIADDLRRIAADNHENNPASAISDYLNALERG